MRSLSNPTTRNLSTTTNRTLSTTANRDLSDTQERALRAIGNQAFPWKFPLWFSDASKRSSSEVT